MLSPGMMLCQPSMAKPRSLPWQTWEVCDEVSSTFAKLSQDPSAVEDSDLQALDRFVVLMYDRSSDVTTVNEQESKDHMTQYHQLKQHSKSMPNMLFIRPDSVGTGIDASARNGQPIRLGMDKTG